MITRDSDFDDDIFIMQMGVAVGTHVGLGAVSLFFLEKARVKHNLILDEVHEFIEKKNALAEKIRYHE